MAVKLFFEDLTPGMAAKLVTRYRSGNDSFKNTRRLLSSPRGAGSRGEPYGQLPLALATAKR